MISPSLPSNASWAAASWSGTEPTSVAVAALAAAEAAGLAAASSFQNLFMQSASLFTPSGQTAELAAGTPGNAPPFNAGNGQTNGGGGGFGAGAAGSDPTTFFAASSWQNSNVTPVSPTPAALSSPGAASETRSAAPSPSEGARKGSEKKIETRAHARQPESGAARSADFAAAGLPADVPAVQASHTPGKTAATPAGSGDRAAAGPSDATAAQRINGALAALGGPAALAGAAFALHISPAGKANNTAPSGAAAAMPKEPEAAAPAGDGVDASDSSASDSSASDSSAGGAPNAAPADLWAAAASPGASLAAARSSLPGATGESLSRVDTAPWSSAGASPVLRDAAKAAESVAPASETPEVAEEESAPGQPVHSVQVQLAGQGDQRVDLRLVEQAGGLSVSVRTTDSSLTRGLQEHLPELTDRLAAEHYQTASLLPVNATSQGGPHGASSGSADHAGQQPSQQQQQSGGRQSPSDGSPSGGGQGNPRRDRQKDPAAGWRALAAGAASASIESPAASPGTNQ